MKGFYATNELQRCNLQPLNKNEGTVKQKKHRFSRGIGHSSYQWFSRETCYLQRSARGLFCWLLTIWLFPFLGSHYIHPRNSRYRYQKSPDLKGVTFSKPSLVSMLVFGGCKSTFPRFFLGWKSNKHSSSSRKKNILAGGFKYFYFHPYLGK